MAKKKKWTHTHKISTQNSETTSNSQPRNCNTLLTNDPETEPLGESLAKAFQLLTFEEMIYVETVELVPTSCHLSSSRCGCHGDEVLPPTSPFKESRILRVRNRVVGGGAGSLMLPVPRVELLQRRLRIWRTLSLPHEFRKISARSSRYVTFTLN